MTKVRSREECLSALQAESAWRKKELTSLRARLDSEGVADSHVLHRAAVLLLYAHWEGFVKNAAELYVCFINQMISRQQVALSDHFRNVLRWKAYRQQGEHLHLRNPAPFIEACKLWGTSSAELLPVDMIDTEANLNTKALKKIAIIIDIDFTPFETKGHLIDDKLLARRNKIAHGERIQVPSDEYVVIEKEVRGLMEAFGDAVEQAVQKQTYCQQSP